MRCTMLLLLVAIQEAFAIEMSPISSHQLALCFCRSSVWLQTPQPLFHGRAMGAFGVLSAARQSQDCLRAEVLPKSPHIRSRVRLRRRLKPSLQFSIPFGVAGSVSAFAPARKRRCSRAIHPRLAAFCVGAPFAHSLARSRSLLADLAIRGGLCEPPRRFSLSSRPRRFRQPPR